MQRVDGRTTRFAHRRGELLSAAADHVLEAGVGDMSLRTLGAAIGISHAALLHHFGTREALLVEVLRELRGRERRFLAERAGEDAAGGGAAAEGAPGGAAAADAHDADLVTILREMWARLSAPDHEPFMRLLFELVGHALRDPGRYGRFLEQLVEDWTGSIEALLRARGAGQAEARALATLLYGAVRGLLLDLVSGGEPERARIDAAFELLVESVAPRLAALGTTPR